MSGWLTTGEVAPWFGTTGRSVLRMLEDPEHAEFAARVRRRGSHLRFPANLTWFYANEARMPASREDLLDFVQRCPVPPTGRQRAQLVTEAASA